MTDFKVGDRVQATGKFNDDKATFTVTEVFRSFDSSVTLAAGGLEFDDNSFNFELVERPTTIPTVAGIYGFINGGGMKLIVTRTGQWFWVDFTTKGAENVFRDFERIKKKEVLDMLHHTEIALEYEYKG